MPEHLALEDFRTRHFDYRAGHHLAIFGPTQIAGKSTLSFALQESVIARLPEIAPVTLCMKHRDRVIAHWTRRLGYREVPAWPPPPRLSETPPFGHKPPGYTLWPRQSLTDIEADNALLEREFRKAITHNRKHTPSITNANELYGMLAELNLRQLLTAVVTRDSVAGHGLWYESQKPSGTQGISIPGFFFNSAEHMFLSKDGEERNRRRYGEIACGIPESEIDRETLALDPYSWLYIRRSGPQWAVIDAWDPALAV
ncbi:MAG TPA: hypothetical protein VGR98_28105 [Streptosporangiaceae bacterium]|nr:hypothetical protein [Streptosporangiaceae bacterium]